MGVSLIRLYPFFRIKGYLTAGIKAFPGIGEKSSAPQRGAPVETLR
jgi:hypothetical protein